MSEVPKSATKTPMKRKKYSIEYKIEVAEYAIKHNTVAASRHFFINESVIRPWIKDLLKLRGVIIGVVLYLRSRYMKIL